MQTAILKRKDMATYIGINTSRLLLRSIRQDDAKDLFRYHSDSVVNRYQGWIPSTIDDVSQFIETRLSQQINVNDTWYQFVIIMREQDKLIGDIGIHFPDQDVIHVEIGWTLDKEWHGKGFATEALTRLLNYIFHDLDKKKITASMDPENIKSIALAERLGFKREAYLKHNVLAGGKWCDDLVYSMRKDEWIDQFPVLKPIQTLRDAV